MGVKPSVFLGNHSRSSLIRPRVSFPFFFDPLRISHCEVLDAEDSFQTLEQTR
jgi:hypothetical protein